MMQVGKATERSETAFRNSDFVIQSGRDLIQCIATFVSLARNSDELQLCGDIVSKEFFDDLLCFFVGFLLILN
jgi:hypothetical protein